MLVGACFVNDFLFFGERDPDKDFFFGEIDTIVIEKELVPSSS
jgi:sulfite reductase alpha subunit-like flavoprotein